MSTIKLIIFDLSGVCFSVEEPLYLEAFIKKHKLESQKGKFLKRYDEMLKRAERGQMSGIELWGILLKEFGVEASPAMIIKEMMDFKIPNVKVLDVAKKLKNDGYTVVYLTNYNKDYWDEILRRFDFNEWFSWGVVSYEIGFRKPEKEGFEYVLKKSKVKPKEAVFIDDLEANLQEPKGLGINTICFKTMESVTKFLETIPKEPLKESEWHFITKRSSIPPLTVLYKLLALSGELSKKLYSVSVPSLLEWRNGKFHWYVHTVEFNKSIKSATSLLSDPRKGRLHIEKAARCAEKLKKLVKGFYSRDLSKIATIKLFSEYNKVISIYSEGFVLGYVTWCSQTLQSRALEILSKYENRLVGIGLDRSSALAVLISHDKKTSYSVKDSMFDRWAKEYQSRLQAGVQDESWVKDELPLLHGEICQFLRKYEWIGYDYIGPVLSYTEILEAIRERKLKRKQRSASKKDILKTCALKKDEANIFEIISGLCYIKDFRNSSEDFVHYHLDRLFHEIGRRFDIDPMQVRYLWPNELRLLTEGCATFDEDYILQKMKYCSVIIDGTENTCLVGEEGQEKVEKMLGVKEAVEEPTGLSGVCASSGKVRGIVKVIENYEQMDKLKNGDILVAGMTSPRLMAAILRAGAIVTDDGGLTCHAAIIAREIRKPCIVGTKIATKILKDGMTVEVDAERGIVSIINKGS